MRADGPARPAAGAWLPVLGHKRSAALLTGSRALLRGWVADSSPKPVALCLSPTAHAGSAAQETKARLLDRGVGEDSCSSARAIGYRQALEHLCRWRADPSTATPEDVVRHSRSARHFCQELADFRSQIYGFAKILNTRPRSPKAGMVRGAAGCRRRRCAPAVWGHERLWWHVRRWRW